MTLDKLEMLARAATPGPWRLTAYGNVEAAPAPNGIRAEMPTICATHESHDSGEYMPTSADAAFIAAANPDAVLALVSVTQAARALTKWSIFDGESARAALIVALAASLERIL